MLQQCSHCSHCSHAEGHRNEKKTPPYFFSNPQQMPLFKRWYSEEPFALQISHITNRRGMNFSQAFFFFCLANRMYYRRCVCVPKLSPPPSLFWWTPYCTRVYLYALQSRSGSSAACFCYGWQMFKKSGYSGKRGQTLWHTKQGGGGKQRDWD